jgi:predicted O-methyltransferase YrrM
MALDRGQLIRTLYWAILRRDPEPGAIEYWEGRLAKGMDLSLVVVAFLESQEYKELNKSLGSLCFPLGHFYSPIVNVSEIFERFWRKAQLPIPASLPGISIGLSSQTRTWQRMLPFLREIPFGPEKRVGLRYYFENPSYSYGDGSVLYSMLRMFCPRRIIEIGSGYSSACTMDTIEHYLDGPVAVTLIEPYPSLVRQILDNDALGRITLHELPVQDVALTVFDELQKDDILFIDSTHIMKTASDVCYELFDILPRLAPGVLIHFHDVFWPFEYPTSWVLEENRSWNELYGLRSFLMYNEQFEIIFLNDYFMRFERELIKQTFPTFLKNTGGSLWLRKLPLANSRGSLCVEE